jgi:hypothetical protein
MGGLRKFDKGGIGVLFFMHTGISSGLVIVVIVSAY